MEKYQASEKLNDATQEYLLVCTQRHWLKGDPLDGQYARCSLPERPCRVSLLAPVCAIPSSGCRPHWPVARVCQAHIHVEHALTDDYRIGHLCQ